MLAQLLIQFQKPIMYEHPLNDTNAVINNSFTNAMNDSINHSRAIRSASFAPDIMDDTSNFNSFGNEHYLDVVKKEPITPLLPTEKSERNEQLTVGLRRKQVYHFFVHAWNDPYWLAGTVTVITFIGCLLSHHYDLRLRMLGAQIRIACCSLIYRKVSSLKLSSDETRLTIRIFVSLQSLRLSAVSASKTGSGYLINLLSNDVGRFDMGFIFAHYIWILPFQVIVLLFPIFIIGDIKMITHSFSLSLYL